MTSSFVYRAFVTAFCTKVSQELTDKLLGLQGSGIDARERGVGAGERKRGSLNESSVLVAIVQTGNGPDTWQIEHRGRWIAV